MKKLAYCSLFLAFIGISVISCKKNEILKNDSIQPIESSNNLKSLNLNSVTTDGSILIFNTVEDYEELLTPLEDAQRPEDQAVYRDSVFLSFIEGLSYSKFKTSTTYSTLVSNKEVENYPELILALLNSDGAIQIGDHIYRLDFINKNVYVIDLINKTSSYQDLVLGNTTNSHVRKYNWDDEVIIIVNNKLGCNENARPPRHEQKKITDKIKWELLLKYKWEDTSYMININRKKFDGELNARYRWTAIGWDLYGKVTFREKTQEASVSSDGSLTFSSSWETSNIPVQLRWARRYKVKCREDVGVHTTINAGTGTALGQSYRGIRALSKFDLAASVYVDPGNGWQLANFGFADIPFANGQSYQIRVTHGY
jgi:hypothetical protein